MDVKGWILICALVATLFWAMGKSADAAMAECQKRFSEATCFYNVR